MRTIKTQKGYTIVEVLIVLAITSAMFTATVLMVSGQISKYKFRAVTYNAQQSVQGAINDVQSGYFALVDSGSGVSGITCTEKVSGGATSPGNTDCVYAGKKVEITTDGKMLLTSYVINDDKNPFDTATVVRPTDNVEVQLPAGVEYTATEFYVLFTNYTNYTSDFVGGSQSVGIFNSEHGASIPIESKSVCVKEGSRKAELIVGANNTLDVQLIYDSAGCP